MSVSKKIYEKINRFEDGVTFNYKLLSIKPQEYAAAAKAIERLITKGEIRRLSTGVFYKPEMSVFGELKPNENEVLKNYLFRDKKRIAYVTGISLYNYLNLTTQIPYKIKIASRDKRIVISTNTLKASSVKSYVDVNDKNFYLLGLLDALKDFNKIPDLNSKSAIIIISNKFKELNYKELKLLIKCSLSYPPRVRAFLGAILENINTKIDLKSLRKSLSPFSKYNYYVENILVTSKNWNIK